MSVLHTVRSGLVFLSLSLPGILSAQPKENGPIENVVVTATRSEMPFNNLPMGLSVISAEQIRESGASQLVDVLRSQGGIEISDLFGDGTDASIGLRGFAATSAQNTLILVDGRRLNNADNSLPDLNTVALETIERIEIVNGSLGTLYGDKAVGGVINIITRTPDALRAEAGTEYGSNKRRSVRAGLEQAFANGFSYRAGATRRLADNERDNNALQLTDGYGTLRYRHENGELFAEMQAQDENQQVPGALFADQVIADRRQALNPTDFVDTDTWAARTGLRQQIAAPLQLLAEYTNRFSRSEGQLSSGGAPTQFDSKRHHTEMTPRLIAMLPAPYGQAQLTLGADLFSTDYRIQSDFGLTVDTQKQDSVYARGVVPLTGRLNGITGVRYGEVRNELLVDTLAFGRSLPEGTEVNDDARAWELGLSYQLNTQWQLFGRVDRNYRFVTADEYSAVADNNFFTGLFAFGTRVPLPSTQTGRSLEAGLNWQGQEASARLQLYQLDIDDEILFEPVLFLNTNAGNTRRRGFTLEAQKPVTSNWSLAATWNYVEAEFMTGRFEGSNLTFVPSHSGSVRTNWQLNEAFSAYIEVAGVSDRVLGGDFANDLAPLDGYLVSNLNITWQKDAWWVGLRVNNLFDWHYSDAANTALDFRNGFVPSATYYPAPDRNVLLSVQYRYE